MFRMTPAVEWLERDYDTVTALEREDYRAGPYTGLCHFQARKRPYNPEADCIGLMFSFKPCEEPGRPMYWRLKVNWGFLEEDWGPLDREVRWL